MSAPAPRPASRAAPAPPADPLRAHEADHGHDSGLAPGQTAADFNAWLARSPAHRAEVAAFRPPARRRGRRRHRPDLAADPHLLVLARNARAEPFEVAPADKWDHIVDTLKFVRDEVVPAVGKVEALSAYRNERLNACSAGAPKSAHRLFFALDLTPVARARSAAPA